MKIKKALAAFAAAAITVSAFPTAAFADDAKQSVIVAVVNEVFTKEMGAAWDGALVYEEIPITEDTTMLSAITDALDSNGYTINAPDSGWGPYISDVNGVGETTYAVQEGAYPGWNVSLNHWFTSSGVSAYTVKDGTLKDGDIIVLEYGITGDDIGNSYNSNDTSLDKVIINDNLFKDFKPDVFEYTVTLDSNELDLFMYASNGVFQTWKYLNTYSPEVKEAGLRPQDKMTVHNGDTVYVGVGNQNWPNSYWGTDTVTESVYKFNIVIDETDADDKAAAEKVEEMIAAIGEVTLDKADAVMEVNLAYLGLTDAQKELVSNADVLQAAIEKINNLVKEGREELYTQADEVYKAVIERLSKEDAVPGNEWKAIGLARSGKYTEAQAKKMIDAIAENVKNATDGKLNDRRCTDNAKAAITAAALGYDPTSIAGTDLLKALADKDYVSKQGITGYIWANIAYSSIGKEAPFVKELMDMQLESGAFSFDGETEDIDLTAMSLTALRGQKDTEDAVKKGLKWLSTIVLSEDKIKSSETLSQILIACYSQKEVFNTLYEGKDEFMDYTAAIVQLLDYYLGEGGFAHEMGGSYDGMATEQALLALTAADISDKAALYDFTGSELKPYTVSSSNTEKDSNPNTAGGITFGLLILSVAGAAIALNKKK